MSRKNDILDFGLRCVTPFYVNPPDPVDTPAWECPGSAILSHVFFIQQETLSQSYGYDFL